MSGRNNKKKKGRNKTPLGDNNDNINNSNIQDDASRTADTSTRHSPSSASINRRELYQTFITLGKSYEDKSDYRKAYDAYERGLNEVMSSSSNYDVKTFSISFAHRMCICIEKQAKLEQRMLTLEEISTCRMLLGRAIDLENVTNQADISGAIYLTKFLLTSIKATVPSTESLQSIIETNAQIQGIVNVISNNNISMRERQLIEQRLAESSQLLNAGLTLVCEQSSTNEEAMMPRSSRGLLSGESTNHLGKSEEEELPEPIKLPSAGAIALQGKITHDDGETILAGNWAEDREELLSEGGYTEQFKYKNIRSSDNDLSGRFYGGFKYDGTDVVDNNLLLSFEPNNRGSYNVTGSGVNVFGSFDIKGILHQDGLVDMRRKYTKQCEAAVKSNNTFKKKEKPRGKGRKRKVEKTSIQASELGEDLSTILSIAKDIIPPPQRRRAKKKGSIQSTIKVIEQLANGIALYDSASAAGVVAVDPDRRSAFEQEALSLLRSFDSRSPVEILDTIAQSPGTYPEQLKVLDELRSIICAQEMMVADGISDEVMQDIAKWSDDMELDVRDTASDEKNVRVRVNNRLEPGTLVAKIGAAKQDSASSYETKELNLKKVKITVNGETQPETLVAAVRTEQEIMSEKLKELTKTMKQRMESAQTGMDNAPEVLDVRSDIIRIRDGYTYDDLSDQQKLLVGYNQTANPPRSVYEQPEEHHDVITEYQGRIDTLKNYIKDASLKTLDGRDIEEILNLWSLPYDIDPTTEQIVFNLLNYETLREHIGLNGKHAFRAYRSSGILRSSTPALICANLTLELFLKTICGDVYPYAYPKDTDPLDFVSEQVHSKIMRGYVEILLRPAADDKRIVFAIGSKSTGKTFAKHVYNGGLKELFKVYNMDPTLWISASDGKLDFNYHPESLYNLLYCIYMLVKCQGNDKFATNERRVIDPNAEACTFAMGVYQEGSAIFELVMQNHLDLCRLGGANSAKARALAVISYHVLLQERMTPTDALEYIEQCMRPEDRGHVVAHLKFDAMSKFSALPADEVDMKEVEAAAELLDMEFDDLQNNIDACRKNRSREDVIIVYHVHLADGLSPEQSLARIKKERPKDHGKLLSYLKFNAMAKYSSQPADEVNVSEVKSTAELFGMKLADLQNNIEASRKSRSKSGRSKGQPKQSLLSVDFSKTGVYQNKFGSWRVSLFYHDIGCPIGSFPTQGDAALANEAARRSLESTRNAILTPEEITANVNQAKEAARLAAGIADPLASFDFTKTGVKQISSGSFSIRFSYHGIDKGYGNFDTREKAALANEVARRSLEPTRNDKLSTAEIEANTNKAKKAALDAVEERYGTTEREGYTNKRYGKTAF